MKKRIPGDPRCPDWMSCPTLTMSHGSGRPERWAENDGNAPWWFHAESWGDIHEALAEGLPVFMDSGIQVESMLDFLSAGITSCRQILIPFSLNKLREQRAIESILNQK